MYIILLNPLNNPYMLCDLKDGIVKFESEEAAKVEAETYLKKHGVNKEFIIINLNNIHTAG